LHIGHVYAALVARDLARGGGRFLLRIDDLDRARCRPEYETMICEDLAWLGIEWEPQVRRQSDCLGEYSEALRQLRFMGLTYPCFCTRKEIMREVTQAQNAPHGLDTPLYPGTCRALDNAKRQARLDAGDAYALRLDVRAALARVAGRPEFIELGAGPSGETGEIVTQPELLGDAVLARFEPGGGEACSYHLAVVVDDAGQGISCVSRGNDLFFATHIQRLLQRLLGLPAPVYRHHALAVDANGKRLAKRHDALSVRELRGQGMTARQVCDLAYQTGAVSR